MDSGEIDLREEELSLEKEDIPRTTADFQEALCQLQKADERLVKAQQDRDRAAELLTRVGVEQSAVLQRYPQVLNSPSAASELSISLSVLEAAQHQKERISGLLDINTVATISSMNSLAEAKEKGAELDKVAQECIAEFREWKAQFALKLNADSS